MTEFKICGLRTLPDALAAADAGGGAAGVRVRRRGSAADRS